MSCWPFLSCNFIEPRSQQALPSAHSSCTMHSHFCLPTEDSKTQPHSGGNDCAYLWYDGIPTGQQSTEGAQIIHCHTHSKADLAAPCEGSSSWLGGHMDKHLSTKHLNHD